MAEGAPFSQNADLVIAWLHRWATVHAIIGQLQSRYPKYLEGSALTFASLGSALAGILLALGEPPSPTADDPLLSDRAVPADQILHVRAWCATWPYVRPTILVMLPGMGLDIADALSDGLASMERQFATLGEIHEALQGPRPQPPTA